ncbi:DUF4362 domain-containing protein [Catellatospora tritici]|uniref:DUF4362 domain-containing protein n=1 Tax=Catellatospora tritici TaxID=2851566 RepID=UPI001C2DB8A3|nr:DUF4362 domain-containing protein [Catellatospora tritici]MBV1853807.1 DUF4362 domain-containing protein [Catellatospora tritici]
MRTATAFVILGLALTAGCDSSDTGTPAAATPRPTASPSARPPEHGTESAACGVFRLNQGETLPPRAGSCLIDAVGARRVAELVVTRPTVEGDPITLQYASTIEGTVIVITDSRLDHFAGPGAGFTTQTCTGPSLRQGYLDFVTCTEPVPTAP